jgi:hypothetical protein
MSVLVLFSELLFRRDANGNVLTTGGKSLTSDSKNQMRTTRRA